MLIHGAKVYNLKTESGMLQLQSQPPAVPVVVIV